MLTAPLTLDQIRHGLRTFTTSFYEAPGRLNVYDEHGMQHVYIAVRFAREE